MFKALLFITTGYLLSNVCDLKTISMFVLKTYQSRNAAKKVSKHKYEIHYTFNNKKYRIKLPILRGPKRICKIINKRDEDITERIKEYLGPNENFLGFIYSPYDFDEEELTFEMFDGTSKTFRENEIITLN